MTLQIDICVATFRRPALLERLLHDLLAQQLPDRVSTHIIVVDNDPLESARPVVSALRLLCPSLEYLTQPDQNIALTRNRALDHSQGELIAFIDDDESAPAGWLAALLATMECHAADAVFGPVTGIVPESAPRWIAKGRFFERTALTTGTRVKVGVTGNALVKASAVRGKVAFDPRYGLSGGSDTDFFHRLWRNGALMVWCQEALVSEYVPKERLTITWLLSRAFRGGQTFADVVGRPEGGLRLAGWLAKRVVVLAAATVLTVSCMPFGKALAMRYARKVATNLGQLSTVLGYRYQEYRH